MPNGHEEKEYGPHKYPDIHSTNDCEYGCGCWVGPFRSGGPAGLDPINGKCPNNPKDGKRREGKIDYKDVVEQRISKLKNSLFHAETELERLKKIKGSEKEELFEELQRVKEQNSRIKKELEVVSEAIQKIIR